MKRGRIDIVCKKVFNLKSHVGEWCRLVHSYAKDAPRELCGALQTIASRKSGATTTELIFPPPETLRIYPSSCNLLLMGSMEADLFLLFPLDGVMRFGHNMDYYPVDDKTLWPWTVANAVAPSLTKDVCVLIYKHLSPREILTFATLCRGAHRAAKCELVWAKRRQWLYEHVVFSRPLLDQMSTWRLYNRISAFVSRFSVPKEWSDEQEARKSRKKATAAFLRGSNEKCWGRSFARLGLNYIFPLGSTVEEPSEARLAEISPSIVTGANASFFVTIDVKEKLVFGMCIKACGRLAHVTADKEVFPTAKSDGIRLMIYAFESMLMDHSGKIFQQEWASPGVGGHIHNVFRYTKFPNLSTFLQE